MNTVLESQVAEINKSEQIVFEFLSDLRNHQLMMPAQVANYIADQVTCSFTITGTGNLALKLKESLPYKTIKLVPNGKVPFVFELRWEILPHESGCTVQAILEAELNFLMKTVAAKPLNNFIDLQVAGLQKYFLTQ